jgi:small-conductance mechanosensitive channel
MPNAKLFVADIYNYRRSAPQTDLIALKVAFNTPKEKLDELQKKLNTFVESDRVDFIKKVGLIIDGFADLESMMVKVTYCHRTNWQNQEMYQARRTKFFKALNLAVKEVGIDWAPLVKPIRILGDTPLSEVK